MATDKAKRLNAVIVQDAELKMTKEKNILRLLSDFMLVHGQDLLML